MVSATHAPGGSGRTLRIRGNAYPVVLPKLSDPRLHLSTTFVFLYLLGELEFGFRVSLPQIFISLLTCGLIEFAVTFWQKRVILWPASALLTGNGIAFIMRIPGTRHGDWWSTRGLWIYSAVGAVSLLSKYLIKFRGTHVFNPSNFGLVLFFLLLGSHRTEPLQFWWGPTSIWLILVLGTIVTGALAILSRLKLLAVTVGFWATFTAALGVLALSGHAMSAHWHLGPVANSYFWSVLIFSPEVFIFMSFMITDPKTVPKTGRGRLIYAVSIGLLGALMIAPTTTEFQSKVALLSSLLIICAARPLIILLREWAARSRGDSLFAQFARVPTRFAQAFPGGSAGRGVLALAATAAFAGVIVLAGTPARSSAGVVHAVAPTGVLPPVTVTPTPGVVALNRHTANEIAGAVVADLHRKTPAYRIAQIRLSLQPAKGQAPPIIVARLTDSAHTVRTVNVVLNGGNLQIVKDSGVKAAPRPKAKPAPVTPLVDLPKGTPSFAKTQLEDVAQQVGLNFTQDAFHFSMSDEPPAMMGGGVCWLDYNNDGWMDLFAVNSYSDADTPDWQDQGGLPRSALFENVHGKFVNVTKSSGAGLQVQGTGCVAGDFNGDGYTDLLVTTATGVDLLWNNGNGTFTEGAQAAGIDASYAWHSGAAVADVNGDGRPDIFVAGYTNMLDLITTSISGFPTNHEGVRDELYLNEGNGPDGRAHFREVGVQAGLDPAPYDHSLGAVFTDVNGDGRPDLYVANDEDPNKLYINVPIAGGAKADPAGLGFRFVNQARAEGVADKNAGMGVAAGDYNDDGRTDLFITNSRHQAHAAYEARAPVDGRGTSFLNTQSVFNTALGGRSTVGWGDSWVDFTNNTFPDLIIANGAIPVTNLKQDTEPIQVLENLGAVGKPGQFGNASGIVSRAGLPKIIGRGLAAADFDNNGRVGVAINTIGGKLVLLENTGPIGNWLDVALSGFHPDSVVTVVLPDGKKLVQELHAGSSYLSSEDPRAHFGLAGATKVKELTVRWPGGTETHEYNVSANQIVTVSP
jgi:Na+-translocating ferredoxin:NAD+ oxidoreductase RnfD subunit